MCLRTLKFWNFSVHEVLLYGSVDKVGNGGLVLVKEEVPEVVRPHDRHRSIPQRLGELLVDLLGRVERVPPHVILWVLAQLVLGLLFAPAREDSAVWPGPAASIHAILESWKNQILQMVHRLSNKTGLSNWLQGQRLLCICTVIRGVARPIGKPLVEVGVGVLETFENVLEAQEDAVYGSVVSLSKSRSILEAATVAGVTVRVRRSKRRQATQWTQAQEPKLPPSPLI